VIALTIHSIAALGKLFSEEVEHIDPGPIEAITATGANLVQTIRYAVIPQIVPPFLAFTLLRWDINMRSATIVGMVAGGGIGFYIVETLRKSAYPQYAAALWAIAVVIMLVDFISAKWRERIVVGETQVAVGKPNPFYTSPRNWLCIILGVLAFVYCWQLSDINLAKMLEPGPNFASLVRGFLSFNLDREVIDEVTREMMLTIFQALLATTLGAFVAIPFSFLAARNLTGRSRLSIWIYYLTRTMFNILRSIEAILYVAIFFYWVSFGNFAGMLALAVTTFALIGKLFSEAIENIDPGPLEAIMATGATRLQAIVYGILPQIIPPFISYAIYQWDINIRMATIVGFAGGGGIGFLLYTKYFPFMSYRSAGTAVALIVIVVAIMDFASAKIRERMV
jgi:phosphonate ABC transporter permease subunit PhnE